MPRTWHDIDDIALDLVDRYPGTDPLSVTLSDLRAMVLALPGFEDAPAGGSDKALEAIQSAWYDEFED